MLVLYLFVFITFVVFYLILLFFFFNDTATTEIYTLSLHDALPILHAIGIPQLGDRKRLARFNSNDSQIGFLIGADEETRSEEHTSELQSRGHLVCRLLLEKKKKYKNKITHDKCTTKRIAKNEYNTK